jgi:histidine ammonia-lyase
LYGGLREEIAFYADDRPLGEDMAKAAQFVRSRTPDELLLRAGLV